MCRTSLFFETSQQQPMELSCDKENRCTVTNYYKLLRADMSQVCDGQTLMQLESEESLRSRTMTDRSRDAGRHLMDAINRLGIDETLSSFIGSLTGETSHGKKLDDFSSMCDEELLSSKDHSKSSSSSSGSSASSSHSSLSSGLDSGSSNSNTSSSSNSTSPEEEDDKPKSVLRRKCKPRHTNSSLNQSISGILKEPRYSNEYKLQRRASLPTKSSRRPSVDSFCSLHSELSFSGSNHSWVPLGVEFSNFMEVYLFED
mmetsp:Transcript_27757/g.47204  ORF Transcript_27757/g.47204 Transcript_27757/m.47204 type:complete len:258 (+) Transcript_27757:94-867(+)